MSFTVTKSSVIQFDNDTSAALESVLNTLQKQSQHVKSVSVLANFSIDHETTIDKGISVVQGLVVQTAKEYKLSEEDQSWFHPCVTKGRSVYSITKPISKSSLQQLDFSSIGNSVGEYSISQADEFGCEQIERRIVVDVSAEKTLEDTYNKWLQQGITAGELDVKMKHMQFGSTYSVASHVTELRNALAKQVSTDAKLVHSDMSHGILSDLSSVYFINAAVKTSPSILVQSSSLGGYRMYNTHNAKQKFYPSNLGKSSSFYSWDELSPQNCAKITDTCLWKGSLSANAQVMTPLSIKSPKQMEEEYNISLNDTLKMTHCAFSPSDSFIDKIDPVDVLRITPTSSQNRQASDSMSAPFNMEHPVLQKLMNNIQDIQTKFPNFKLFNPKVVSGGRITLPREVYKHVI